MTGVFRTGSLEAIKAFANCTDQLGIVERTAPAGADAFFQKLMSTPFGINGMVRKESALNDVSVILEEKIPGGIKTDPFFDLWVGDMVAVCKTFCEMENGDAIGFWLGSQRGCRRYHIDNVPQRMLVTYAGKGTEWLPDEAADRNAYMNGMPNEKILKDKSALKFMNKWDVAVFRGGPKGLLHRTPDAALNGPSILMRLDPKSFWEYVEKHQNHNRYAS
ncbi:MAG: DUF1826 domain-containing protein [Roseovarius sp.]|nr:DUF1826 domain-containing protein [Roseovarius sp.]MCY4316150.1 DUF1826 domain-containing protein [Roseovarius sp.]